MIDITVDNNSVDVDGDEYHSFNDRDRLVAMLENVIEKCLYSGESISLWAISGDSKHAVGDWRNPHMINPDSVKYVRVYPPKE